MNPQLSTFWSFPTDQVLQQSHSTGLTTAVAIWLSCSLGIATGCGLWSLGVLGAIFALLTLSVLKKLEKH